MRYRTLYYRRAAAATAVIILIIFGFRTTTLELPTSEFLLPNTSEVCITSCEMLLVRSE